LLLCDVSCENPEEGEFLNNGVSGEAVFDAWFTSPIALNEGTFSPIVDVLLGIFDIDG